MSAVCDTFEELQTRNYVLLARAGRVSKALKGNYYRAALLPRLVLIDRSARDIVRELRDPILEQMASEDRIELVKLLQRTHSKTADMVNWLSRIDFGPWTMISGPRIASLKHYIEEIAVYIGIMLDSDEVMLSLTKREQERLLHALQNPPEPSDTLRKSVERYSTQRYTA